MSSLIAGYVTREKLTEILQALDAKAQRGDAAGAKGFAFTASVNEESNQFGQNVSFYAEQTKEQREAKAPKYYFGNGKVFWTDGKISLATKEAPAAAPVAAAAPAYARDLPF